MTGLGVGEYNTCEVKSLTNCCYNNLPLHKRFVITINFNKWDLGTGVFLVNPLRLAVLTAEALGSVSDSRSPFVSCSNWRDHITEEQSLEAKTQADWSSWRVHTVLATTSALTPAVYCIKLLLGTWLCAERLPSKLLYVAPHRVPHCFIFIVSLTFRASNMRRARALTPPLLWVLGPGKNHSVWAFGVSGLLLCDWQIGKSLLSPSPCSRKIGVGKQYLNGC